MFRFVTIIPLSFYVILALLSACLVTFGAKAMAGLAIILMFASA